VNEANTIPIGPPLREAAWRLSIPYDTLLVTVRADPTLAVKVPGGKGALGWSWRVVSLERLAAAVAARPCGPYKTRSYRPRLPEPRTCAPVVDHALG